MSHLSRIIDLPIDVISMNLQTIFASKSSEDKKYLGNHFAIVSSKEEPLDLASIIFYCTNSLFFNLPKDNPARLKNVTVILNLKKIISEDYPEYVSLISSVLITGCYKIELLAVRVFWLENCRDFLFFEKTHLENFGTRAELVSLLANLLKNKPKQVELKQQEGKISFQLHNPQISSARMIAFLIKVFKGYFNPTLGEIRSINLLSEIWIKKKDLFLAYSTDEDPEIATFARTLLWTVAFQEIHHHFINLFIKGIEFHKNIRRFETILQSPDLSPPLKTLADAFTRLNSELIELPSREIWCKSVIDLERIDLYEKVAHIYREYLVKQPLKEFFYQSICQSLSTFKVRYKGNLAHKKSLAILRNSISHDTLSFKSPTTLSHSSITLISEEIQYIKNLIDPCSSIFIGEDLVASFISKPKSILSLPVAVESSPASSLSSSSSVSIADLSPEADTKPVFTKVIPLHKPEAIINVSVTNFQKFIKTKSTSFAETVSRFSIPEDFYNFDYAERLKIWFDHPDEALDTPRYRSLPLEIKNHVTFIHTFPKLIDVLIGSQFSTFMLWHHPERRSKPKWLFAIPCEVEKNDKIDRGFLIYTIDPETKICYHRCFDIETEKLPFGTALMQGWGAISENFSWDEADFPTLEESMRRFTEKKSTKRAESEEWNITYEPRTEILTLNNADSIIYRFFKIL